MLDHFTQKKRNHPLRQLSAFPFNLKGDLRWWVPFRGCTSIWRSIEERWTGRRMEAVVRKWGADAGPLNDERHVYTTRSWLMNRCIHWSSHEKRQPEMPPHRWKRHSPERVVPWHDWDYAGDNDDCFLLPQFGRVPLWRRRRRRNVITRWEQFTFQTNLSTSSIVHTFSWVSFAIRLHIPCWCMMFTRQVIVRPTNSKHHPDCDLLSLAERWRFTKKH